MDMLLERIGAYWDKRAVSYTDVIKKNLFGERERLWADMLISHFPLNGSTELKVLDIGTGPGFYAMILAARGYHVTAVDYSEGMLNEARRNAGALAERIDFRRMDAQHLDLPDESFDVIVTRNLTWNLEDPVQAYRDWHRVLRPGGILLNFDANWYAYLFDDQKKEAFERDRTNTREAGYADHNAYEDGKSMEKISMQLPMGRLSRPRWDLLTLMELGFSSVIADTEAGSRVWEEEEKINYASTPGFLICATK